MTDSMRSITVEIPIPVAQKLNETFEGTLEDAARAGLKLINGMGAPAYNLLNELALKMEVTPAKALRTAITLLERDAIKYRLSKESRIPLGRPRVNEARDLAIYERVQAGATQMEASIEFDISVVRIAQIVAYARAKRGESASRAKRRKPNPMQMYAALAEGIPVDKVAAAHNMTPEEVETMYNKYKTRLPANPTMSDRVNTARLVDQKAQEVLTLKDSPTAPRKLAVIPPSMRNPELFAALKPIEPVDFENLDNRIFSDDFEF